MVEKKKKRKGTITEQNIATLLQRYSPTTIISLLQEIAQAASEKFDWQELVKNTSTGISNAREYQMLWRHLAYRDPITGELEDDATPLDDDSDVEFELEAHPPVSGEASIEATAFVKVLIASGLHGVSSLASGMTVEAPLTINIPTSVGGSEDLQQQGTNITIPVCVPKQPLNLPTVPPAEINGPTFGHLPPKKKRKQWSEEEDTKLRAAVLRCGDGSWATILKEDFCGERTTSQLAQRWSAIKKRQQGNVSNAGGSSQLSEVHLAARRAMSLALDMPIDNIKPTISNTGGITLSQQDSGPVGSKKVQTTAKGSMGAVEDPVKAAAVAAGARIASASDAASLLMAARGKSAVHMTTTGSGLPPNVHFIRTGLISSTNSLIHARPQLPVPHIGSSSLKSASTTTNAAAAAELLTNNKTTGKDSEENNKPLDKTVENVISKVKEEKEEEAVSAPPPPNEIVQTMETLKIGGDTDLLIEDVGAENVQLEDDDNDDDRNKKLEEDKKEDGIVASSAAVAAATAILNTESWEIMTVKEEVKEEAHISDQMCGVESNNNVNDEELSLD